MSLRPSLTVPLALLLLYSSPDPGAGQDSMTFRAAGNGGNCEDCVWTAAEGRITAETPEEFLAYWEREERDGSPLLALHSPGGELLAGVELGRLLRERGIRTRVARTTWDGEFDPSDTVRWEGLGPGECSSACAYAFLGGVSRTTTDPDSRLGFHQFYRDPESGGDPMNDPAKSFGALDSSQLLMGLLLEYVLEMGVDPQLLQVAVAVPPGDIYYPDQELLQTLGVVTTAGLGRWSIVPSEGRLVARASDGDSRYRIREVAFTCIQQDSTALGILVPSSHNSSGMFRGDDAITLSLDDRRHRIPLERIATSEDGPTVMVLASLTPTEEEALLQATTIEITFNVARAFGFHHTVGSLTEVDRSMLSAVARNCQ